MSILSPGIAQANDQTLIGGKPVKDGEYPEVVRIRSCSSSGCAACTASVVGERTVITAGHCLKSDEISFKLEGVSHKAQCESHPLYPHTEDMDMALCKSEKPMKTKYAHISLAGVKVRDVMTLIGYGCTEPRDENGNGGGRGGNDGILRVGEAPVIQLPRESPVNNWFYTRGDTTLCFGDSGGPAFERVIDPKNEIHYIAGINSRGNIRDLALLTAIYLPKGVSFMKDYERRHGVKICGIGSQCQKEDKPDPEPEPEPDCKEEKDRLIRYQDKVDESRKILELYEDKQREWEDKLRECRGGEKSIYDIRTWTLPFPE